MIPAAFAISKSNSAIFNSKAVEYSTCIVEKKTISQSLRNLISLQNVLMFEENRGLKISWSAHTVNHRNTRRRQKHTQGQFWNFSIMHFVLLNKSTVK